MKSVYFKKLSVPVFALIVISFAVAGFGRTTTPAAYKFQVHNIGKNRITKIFASEDGEKYRPFDIGDGIAPGETETIEWDKSTDESNCEWLFKARFDDNLESEPVKFDFCKTDLVIDIH